MFSKKLFIESYISKVAILNIHSTCRHGETSCFIYEAGKIITSIATGWSLVHMEIVGWRRFLHYCTQYFLRSATANACHFHWGFVVADCRITIQIRAGYRGFSLLIISAGTLAAALGRQGSGFSTGFDLNLGCYSNSCLMPILQVSSSLSAFCRMTS